MFNFIDSGKLNNILLESMDIITKRRVRIHFGQSVEEK